jgi:hypothetical protein
MVTGGCTMWVGASSGSIAETEMGEGNSHHLFTIAFLYDVLESPGVLWLTPWTTCNHHRRV